MQKSASCYPAWGVKPVVFVKFNNVFGSLKPKLEPTIGIEPMNLILTKDALYRLSYVGFIAAVFSRL